jgi:hypothetical protein
VEFNTAAAIAGQTISQTIRGQHDGKIESMGDQPLSDGDLKKGSVNMAVMGAVEICPQAVPTDTRDRVAKASVLAADNAKESRPIQSQATASHQPIAAPRPASAGELAQAITVQVESAGPSGSGTLVARSRDSYTILSACHVLLSSTGQEDIVVITHDQKRHLATQGSLKKYGDSDLCSIRFRARETYFTPKIGGAMPAIGSIIHVSGWALATADLGTSLRFVKGIISGRGSSSGADGYALAYTTDAPTLAGMSGGPILHDLELIGIHGRAERAGTKTIDGKEMATSTSLGIPVSLSTVTGD